MDYPEITKLSVDEMAVRPNLDHRHVLGSDFDWRQMEREMGIQHREELNLAHLAIDRHAASSLRDKVALYWEGKNGETESYTFGELYTLTNKFANVLAGLGVAKGDRVFTFIERLPELYIAVFGGLKLGAIVGPLFADFGPNPLRDRLRDSGAKVLVTSPALRLRIASVLPELPDLKYLIMVDRNGQRSGQAGDISYQEALAGVSPDFAKVRTGANDYSLMHYTSGATGRPKGAVHIHHAAVQHYAIGKWALDLHEDDVYWCAANPGWVTRPTC